MMIEKHQRTAAAAFATCCVMKKIILLAFASLYLMCVKAAPLTVCDFESYPVGAQWVCGRCRAMSSYEMMLSLGRIAHDKAQYTTLEDVVVVEVGVGVGLAVEGGRLDIAALTAGARGFDGEGASVLEV